MKSADATENIGILIAEIARLWRYRLDQRLQPLGLSQAKWLVLVHLWHGHDGLIQKELAQRIGIEGPTLVGLLDRMAEDGWVVRREAGHDRRSKTVHLTGKAHEILKKIKTEAAQLRKEILADIPPAQVQRCANVLQRIKKKAESL